MSDAISAIAKALAQYPALKRQGLAYTESPGRSDNYLEYWPAGETGGSDFPRPSALPMNQPGIENYRSDTKPLDILADVASHKMVNDDPAMGAIYGQFKGSMQPWQNEILHEQYGHARQTEGETRPFDEWSSMTGVPAYLRGYAFDQWPGADKMYTSEQRALLDGMRAYLGVGQTGPR